MIVISGALVVVALVLLVIGLVAGGISLVYASIGVSLLSFVFLVFGILQRRKEVPAGETAAAVPTPFPVAPVRDLTDEATVATVRPQPAGTAVPAAAGQVLVVEGRPRYHVDGCRYLTGKDAESVEVTEAQAQGFTACGVCKPDAALTAAPEPIEEADDEFVVAAPARPRTAAARTAAARTTATRTTATARKAPAKKATTARKAVPAKAAAKAVPAKAAAKAAPAKAAAKAAPAKAAAKKAAAPAKKAVAPAKAAPAKAAAKKAAAPAKKAPAKKAPAKRA